MLPCRDIFAVPDTVLLHRRFTLRRARHSSAARFVSALLQTGSTRINCTKCLIRRCRALQRAKELRNTGMLRLRKLTHMCSRTVSDLANRFRKTRKKKSSAVPLFRSSHMSAICARLGSKGKVGVQRGRETAGVPSFFAPAAGRGTFPPSADGESPAEVQRKTLQPVRGRNPRDAVRMPRSAGAEKECQPRQGEHANTVRAPRSAGAEKQAAAPFVRTACAVRVSRLTLRSYLTILREQSMLSQQQNRRKYEPVHPCALRSVPRH